MKTTILPKPQPTSLYPYLGISRNTGAVVLFYRRSAGVLLVKGSGNTTEVGYQSESWSESDFEKFTAQIILEN